MTLRTFLAAATRFRRAATALKPGAPRARAARGHSAQAYEAASRGLEEAFAEAVVDIRRIERLLVLATRSAEHLRSVQAYEARMKGSKAETRWDWQSISTKLAEDLGEAVGSMGEPDGLLPPPGGLNRTTFEPLVASSMTDPVKTRNSDGVKWSSDCFRTIGGLRWGQWISEPSKELVSAYRAEGVRCRKVTQSDGAVELFVHPEDEDKAAAVDATFVQPDEPAEGGHPQP